MEQLLKNWKLIMVKYRQEADNAKTPITRVKAMNKFFIYRDCIKELEEQLLINGVVVSKSIIDELNCAHNEYHQIMMKEVEPLSRQYFEAYGRREGVATAIEIITGEEM